MPRALLLTGDAAEELDTMYPYYRVQEGGWDVDVASRTLRPVQLVIHEFDPDSDAYVEKNGRKLPVDLPWSEVDVERYDALIIPGGRAPEYIRVDADVRRITEHFFARDLPIALVCHGAQVPAVYGLLKGRRTACFPPITGDMENAGATVVDAPDVVDGNLVSCRGWPDMPQFGRAMMELFSKSVSAHAGMSPARPSSRPMTADATVDVDGSPVQVLEGGEGPAVLLLHGSGPGTTGSGAWATTARGARLVLPPRRARPGGVRPHPAPDGLAGRAAALDGAGRGSHGGPGHRVVRGGGPLHGRGRGPLTGGRASRPGEPGRGGLLHGRTRGAALP